jgi:hypothetical protein
MASTRKRPATRATTSDGKSRPRRPTKARLDNLVEEAIVDCYDEAEEAMGLLTMIENNLGLPFETSILGVPVMVERVAPCVRRPRPATRRRRHGWVMRRRWWWFGRAVGRPVRQASEAIAFERTTS